MAYNALKDQYRIRYEDYGAETDEWLPVHYLRERSSPRWDWSCMSEGVLVQARCPHNGW